MKENCRIVVAAFFGGMERDSNSSFYSVFPLIPSPLWKCLCDSNLAMSWSKWFWMFFFFYPSVRCPTSLHPLSLVYCQTVMLCKGCRHLDIGRRWISQLDCPVTQSSDLTPSLPGQIASVRSDKKCAPGTIRLHGLWLKKIIWMTGVLRRPTIFDDWRFDKMCGSHL